MATLRLPVTGDERAEALAKIITDAEAMCDLAKRADLDFLAFLLANVLEEARSVLVSEGYVPRS